jgi:Asp-tRNA(Asn)/Glu-tRNA(Gln) amidotransferase C subunit
MTKQNDLVLQLLDSFKQNSQLTEERNKLALEATNTHIKELEKKIDEIANFVSRVSVVGIQNNEVTINVLIKTLIDKGVLSEEEFTSNMKAAWESITSLTEKRIVEEARKKGMSQEEAEQLAKRRIDEFYASQEDPNEV